MKLAVPKDKRQIITLPHYLHKKIKMLSVKKEISMNLLITEALKQVYDKS